jgi:hypothetical protein
MKLLPVLFLALAVPYVPGAPPRSLGQAPGEQISSEAAWDRALGSSSLTFEGQPFHAVMEIGKPGDEYSGTVEVWWEKSSVYRTKIVSPKFSQDRVVNGEKVFERDMGDYYPRWLENFVLAMLDPVPMAENFRGRGGLITIGAKLTDCFRRDDRPGGITDQMTWGIVCLKGAEPRLQSVLTTNMDITFDDWSAFGEKQIARTVTTDVEGYDQITGHLTTLEPLTTPDASHFDVKEVTPPEQRIATRYVSTREEESMVETVPDIHWPSVREGKTDGYMIVYARTDRTGQVRETSKHNSDQPGLEDFAMTAALKYKFKPLVVNGIAEQMEMPLVLHFTSRLEDPLPILNVEAMKKQMHGCVTEKVALGTAIVTTERVLRRRRQWC